MRWMSLDPLRTLYLFNQEGGDGSGGDGDGSGDGDEGTSLLGGDAGDGEGTGEGDGDKPEGEGGEGKPSGSTDGAPEQYADFAVPTGMEIDQKQLDAFVPVAKELNLTQEQAQKVVDLQVKAVEAQQSAWKETSAQWHKELREDPIVGGAEFAKNVERARSLIDRIAGDDAADLKEFLNTSGYGNFPPLFRFIHKLAGAISEDGFPGKTGVRQKSHQESEEERLAKRFPKMAEALSGGDK
jgi:hypothetical protein